MAVSIRYTGLAPTEIQLNVSEEDMAAVYDIVANYFFAMLPFLELNKYNHYTPEKTAIADFASKYHVPIDHPTSIVNFYRAILGRPEKGSADSRPQLEVAQQRWRTT